MACASYSLKGMQQECDGAVAGLKRLLIGLDREWDLTADDATQSVTIAAKTGVSNAKFYEYYITDESSSLTSTLNVNNQNGVKYYSNVINATFVRMTPAKHLEMKALANEKLIVIAVDNNGVNWVLGVGSAATASEETAQSGQAFDDLSGYQVVISQRSGSLPYAVNQLPTIADF